MLGSRKILSALFVALLVCAGGCTTSTRGCGNAVAPELLSSVGAQAPPGFWDTHEGGEVVLQVWVELDGGVSVQRVVRSSGKDYSDVAIATVTKWQYKPGSCNGSATRTDLTMTLSLRPDDKPAS